MNIRALKTTTDWPKGRVGYIDDYTGRYLIAQGYAIEVLPLDEQEAANDNSPFDAAHQDGGLTGADVPPSLSQVGQAPKTLTCPLSEDAETTESSPSTTDTDSARGQMSSTPATTTGGKRKRGRPRSKG